MLIVILRPFFTGDAQLCGAYSILYSISYWIIIWILF